MIFYDYTLYIVLFLDYSKNHTESEYEMKLFLKYDER